MWIWPDNSSSAESDSESCTFPTSDDLVDYLERSRNDGTYSLYVRYLPYSFDVLIENLADPSHFIVSHHKAVPGISRYNAHLFRTRKMKTLQDGGMERSMTYTLDGGPFQSRIDLRFPGYLCEFHASADTPIFRVLILAYPVCIGESVIIGGEILESQIAEKTTQNFFHRIGLVIKNVMRHVYEDNYILDGDNVFLHEQEKKVRKLEPDIILRSKYYMSTGADQLVIAFRKWYETVGANAAGH